MAGDALLMVDTGSVPAEKMFADAVSANTLITWLLRLVGLVLLAIGFALLLAPLGVIADFIPFVGSIVRFGTGLIAFLCAIPVGTTTIADCLVLLSAAARHRHPRGRLRRGCGDHLLRPLAPRRRRRLSRRRRSAPAVAAPTAAAGTAPTTSKWN